MELWPRSCFICGGQQMLTITSPYQACATCGHEILSSGEKQAYMLNDPLDEKAVKRVDLLERFRGAVLRRFSHGITPVCLVDIGSSTGKFLFHNRHRFQSIVGIEISESAVEFSSRVCSLPVFSDLNAFEGTISVATCWHSLEHFPTASLHRVLDAMTRRMRSGSRVIVSVPNSTSWQYRIFREAYAFFDVPNHLHQFSPQSLRLLLERFGFYQTEMIVSWPYNIFGYIQGLLNVMTGTHNYLYCRFKRRSLKSSTARDLLHVMLAVIVAPFGCTLAVVDSLWPGRQGVITVCFEKK
jgi:hypothetical protein